ncbi:MAG TPA: MATE family efflux transporter [Candidatus Binataceae bacterium]|nr:MATE family efflux transporter [Candidatus Binataceae bacterium]
MDKPLARAGASATGASAPPFKAPRAAAPLTQGSITLAILRLSFPIIISNILQTAYQVVDTFWVGRLSAAAVAAVSFCFPVSFLLIALGGGLPIAGTVLLAQYTGRGDQEATNHVAAQTLLMVFLISLVLAATGYNLATPMMRLMGAAPDVLPDAVRFFQIAVLGFIFVFAFFAYQALMRGRGIVYPPMVIVFVTVVINFALDPLLIFGWGPFPKMGVAGSALATLCTQALAAAIGLTLMVRGRHGIHLRWRDLAPDFTLMRRIFRIGFPSSIEQSTQALGMTVMTMLVAGFGTDSVAAYGIGVRVMSCALVPAIGLSVATSALVGQNIGANQLARAERTNTVSCLLAFVTLSLAGLLAFWGAPSIGRFFIPQGGDVIGTSSVFIRAIALTFGFIGLQQVLTGSLRGAGDTVAPMVLAMISLWVLRFPLAYVLSTRTTLHVRGIWYAFPVTTVLSAVMAAYWFMWGGWREKRLIDDDEFLEIVREQAAIEEGSSF